MYRSLKLLTILLTAVSLALTAWILVPPPFLSLLPLNIAAAELSPLLLVIDLVSLGLALRFYWKAIPITVLSVSVVCLPIYQIHTVKLLSTDLPLEKPGNRTTLSVLLRCAGSIRENNRVQPQTLPLHILYYKPHGDGPRPALIEIYGGAWQKGAPDQSHLFDSYMALHGFAVFAIDYRHAPAFQFPAQLDDVQTALSFLYSNAGKYNIDPRRLVLCGRSAGAELALLAAYRSGGVPVRAVISFYGPTDLTSGYTDRPFPDPIDVRSVLEKYLGGSPPDRPESYRDASPVHYVRPALPATLLIQGARDHVVKAVFAQELYKKLQASGNRAALLIIPWSEHGFDFVIPGLGNQVCLPYIDEFLRKEVGD